MEHTQATHHDGKEDIISFTFTTSESRVIINRRTADAAAEQVGSIDVSEHQHTAEDWEVVDGEPEVTRESDNAAEPSSAATQPLGQCEDQATEIAEPQEEEGDDGQQSKEAEAATTSFVFIPSSLEAQQGKNRTPSQEMSRSSTGSINGDSTSNEGGLSASEPCAIKLLPDVSFQLLQEEQRVRHSLSAEEKRLFQLTFATASETNEANSDHSAFLQGLHEVMVRQQIAADKALAEELEQKAVERYTAAKELARIETNQLQQNPERRTSATAVADAVPALVQEEDPSRDAAATAPPPAVSDLECSSRTADRQCDCLGATSGIHRPTCKVQQKRKKTWLGKLVA